MKKLVATLGALALAGCAIGPDYRRPAVVEAPAYRAETAAGEAESLADLPWWEVFQDEALRALIGESLANNHDLRIAAQRVEEFRARAGIARSEFFPQIGGEFDAARGTNSVLGSPAPGADRDDSFLLAAGMAWEIDVWGRIRRSTEAARAELFASEAFRRGVLLTLTSDVASSYFELIGLDLELEIARSNVAAFTKMRDLFERKFSGGVDSKLGMLRAQASLSSAAAAIPEIERRIVAVENRLSALLGRAPGPIPRGADLLQQTRPPRVPAGVPAQLLSRRPDVLEAEQVVVAANALVGVSISEFLPRIGLTGLLGGVSTDLDDVLQQRNALWSIAGVATTPIFQGGAIYYGWEEAKARWEQAAIAYESTVIQALRDVSDSLTAREKLEAIRKEQALAVEALEESVRISNIRYVDGRASYLEVLDAQKDLFPAQTLLAQTDRARLIAIVQIYRALGGGWSQYTSPQPAPAAP
ncbi:MAG: efflux transporter outer membrane subunit [Deltaproteobacteria bacterium]|nr:efflux transporter outer membrane subunit [Deltaproteobacteria bacterium]